MFCESVQITIKKVIILLRDPSFRLHHLDFMDRGFFEFYHKLNKCENINFLISFENIFMLEEKD